MARADRRYANLEERFNQTNEILKKLSGVFNPEQAQKRDPRAEALRNRLIEVIPELKDILALAGRTRDLEGLLEQAPTFAATQDRHWKTHAASTIAKVTQEIAPFMLGDGVP